MFAAVPLSHLESNPVQDVLITGLGIACPLGIGCDDVWNAVENRESGVRAVPQMVEAAYPIPIAGKLADFEPKLYVKPRKSLKVMCRETQLAFTAAELTWVDAGLDQATVDPERLGVIVGTNIYQSDIADLTGAYLASCQTGQFDLEQFGSVGMREMNPLWMLKYLPNMAACHIGIARDARGPINTIVHGDVSSLLAIIEAASVISRGQADVMLAGGASSMLSQVDLAWHGSANLSQNIANPAAACRPFDALRDGAVGGEGAAIFVLESRAHAEARQGRVLGKVLGYGRRYGISSNGQPPSGTAVRGAIEAALESSQLQPSEIGHVNAHGLSTVQDDALEAQAIHHTLGDVPVTAPKSFFGNLGAGSGAVELAVSLMGMQRGIVPPTLNYDQPDPNCPVNLVAAPQASRSPAFMTLNHKLTGQATALVVGAG
jgi:3-oxoacyl-[acyl-carrier-protein] synthase II